jgi:hypothetical protein
MIAKIGIAAFMALAVAGCAKAPVTTQAVQADANVTNAPVAQPFAPVNPSKDFFRNPLEMAELLRNGFPESAEGRQRLEVTLEPLDDEKSHLTVRSLGLLDDAVSGKQFRATIARKAEGWYMLSLEANWRCARGDKPTEWVITPCP